MSSTPSTQRRQRLSRRLRKNPSVAVGTFLLVFVVLSAVFTSQIATHDPIRNNLSDQFRPPSAGFLMGTDQYGRDVFSRVVWGARTSLLIGVATIGLGGTIGTALGLFAGYSKGVVHELLGRAIDVLMSFPTVLVALVIVGVAGGSNTSVVVAIAIGLVPRFARVVRGQVLQLRTNEYIIAAQAMGAGTPRILFLHILRNAIGPILVLATLYLPYAILVEATLTFLGVGVSPEQPTWGRIIADGRSYLQIAWWISVFPGFAIMLTVMGFNLLGDGLRDVLDPKLR